MDVQSAQGFSRGRIGLRTDNFDPLAYIESAWIDESEEAAPETPVQERISPDGPLSVEIPSIADYLGLRSPIVAVVDEEPIAPEDGEPRARFRKTVMSAPRPRRVKQKPSAAALDPELQQVWTNLPKNVAFLCRFYDDGVTANYYRGEFKETRQELIRRLLDPELSLEETSRLLGVCPATVRRYTNRGWLEHHRTTGGQRRFRLSNVVKFLDTHGRFPEE